MRKRFFFMPSIRYSHCVWVGDPWPPETERKASSRKTQQAVQNGRERSRLDNQEGEIVYRNLSGLGYIYFEHNGSRETATFHSAKLIKDGKRISHGDFKGWPTNHKYEQQLNAQESSNSVINVFFFSFREKVKFNAVAIPPKVHVQKELGDGESMDVNITYESRWRCEVVWMPPEPMPSQEVLTEVSLGKKHLSSLAKDAKDKDFYICGKLTHFVDKSTGIIQHSKLDQAVLFKIQDLFIDGVRPDPDARLSSILQVGETLFSFSKPLIPSKTIGATVCNMTATQIWKGKRNKSAGEAMDEDSSDKSKKKVPYPDPRAATDINQSGVVIEIQGVLGKLKLTSDDPARDGQKVLLSKNRTYINGHKIRFKDFLHDYVQLGERLSFDMIEADQSAANGEYQWLALLSWKNVRPTQEEVDFDFEKGRKDFSLKAKIIKFDDHDPKQGFCSGVLQIYAGPNNVGERVIFHREQLYVFSTRMAKADLAYIFKTNDRVQVNFTLLTMLLFPLHRVGFRLF